MKIPIFNDDGEPLGFDHVYDDDPNDWADVYDEDDAPSGNHYRDRDTTTPD